MFKVPVALIVKANGIVIVLLLVFIDEIIDEKAWFEESIPEILVPTTMFVFQGAIVKVVDAPAVNTAL